jgi:hypothetical protein
VLRRTRLRAAWDDQARAFTAETGVPGVRLATPTLRALLRAVRERAPELLAPAEPEP